MPLVHFLGKLAHDVLELALIFLKPVMNHLDVIIVGALIDVIVVVVADPFTLIDKKMEPHQFLEIPDRPHPSVDPIIKSFVLFKAESQFCDF